jgi:hypothetical protein
MTYTVKDLEQRYEVTEKTVLSWVRSGDIKALNVGVALGKKRARYRSSAGWLRRSARPALRHPEASRRTEVGEDDDRRDRPKAARPEHRPVPPALEVRT